MRNPKKTNTRSHTQNQAQHPKSLEYDQSHLLNQRKGMVWRVFKKLSFTKIFSFSSIGINRFFLTLLLKTINPKKN